MMIRHCMVLALLPLIISARVLPAHNPDERIDEKKPGQVNQEFLSAFLGNVQDSESSVKPIIDEIQEPTNFNSGSTNGNEKKTRTEDGYDDGYGNDIYDDGYYEDDYGNDYTGDYGYEYTNDHDSDKEAQYYKASINCREFHYPHATTATQCRNVKVRDYEPDYNRDDANEKAFCRWDMGFSDDKDQHEGCLCPRTKYKCHKSDQCYWYKPKHSDHKDDKDNGQCLHNSERFYNILANLLSKRGKKDFALKIKYSSAAAKGHLPYGPYGPGFFPYDHETYKHSSIGNEIGYNGNQNEYDNSYRTPHGYDQQDYDTQHNDGYGYYNNMGGYGGYNSIGGYGTHNHGGYGSHNHGGYGSHNHKGQGAHSHFGGYGAPNHIGGYGTHNQLGGYGTHNQIGGYGTHNQIGGYGTHNQIGGYGSHNQIGGHEGFNGGYHSISNNQYSTGYDVNQGYNDYNMPYDYNGYGNSQPIYNPYPAVNLAPQSPGMPINGHVPFQHGQSNYVENTVYPPAREAHSLIQNVQPIAAPEYNLSPQISEQPIHSAYPPVINSAQPYQNAPSPNVRPYGQVAPSYGTNTGYPPVREANSLVGTPVNMVNAQEYQAGAPPVNVPAYQAVAPQANVPLHQTVPSPGNGPVHQYRHPTQPYFY